MKAHHRTIAPREISIKKGMIFPRRDAGRFGSGRPAHRYALAHRGYALDFLTRHPAFLVDSVLHVNEGAATDEITRGELPGVLADSLAQTTEAKVLVRASGDAPIIIEIDEERIGEHNLVLVEDGCGVRILDAPLDDELHPRGAVFTAASAHPHVFDIRRVDLRGDEYPLGFVGFVYEGIEEGIGIEHIGHYLVLLARLMELMLRCFIILVRHVNDGDSQRLQVV